MITKLAPFHKCDRCGHEEFGPTFERRVLFSHTERGGRLFYLCQSCYRDVLNFCGGLDGPYQRIVSTPTGSKRSLKERLQVHNA